MAANKKLGRPTDERLAVLRSQATALLWYGKVETTVEKAKAVRSYAEKLLTLAINTYKDTVKVKKEVANAKGEKVAKEVVNDGPTKLAARRKLMGKLYDIQEQKQMANQRQISKREQQMLHTHSLKRFSMCMHQNMTREKRNLDKVADTPEFLNLVQEEATMLKWQL